MLTRLTPATHITHSYHSDRVVCVRLQVTHSEDRFSLKAIGLHFKFIGASASAGLGIRIAVLIKMNNVFFSRLIRFDVQHS